MTIYFNITVMYVIIHPLILFDESSVLQKIKFLFIDDSLPNFPKLSPTLVCKLLNKLNNTLIRQTSDYI